jgi:hypothetical protein
MSAITNTTRLTFVPEHDEAAWLSLSAAAKSRAETLFEIAKKVHAAPRSQKGKIYQAHAAALGYKHVNGLYGPINRFLKTGDWRHLVDRRKDASTWLRAADNKDLPHAFVEYWKTLVENNQRCASAAYDFLMDQLRVWRGGDISASIPGYNTPPANAPGCRHPAKWSLRDLRRKGPNATELAAARHGRTAALKHCPAVITTRKGGWCGMEFQFDDMHHDLECRYGAKLARPLEYGCIDFYSNFYLPPGIKPRLLEDGHHTELTELEFALYAVNILCTIGYSPRGTTLMAENAKAVFRDGLAMKIRRWTNDLCKPEAGAVSGAPTIPGGWNETAKGNANSKALKEGFGKIYHNRLASLPGQLGMNPDDMPAYMVGMRKETQMLLEAQGHLNTQLITSHLTFDHVVQHIYHKVAAINGRTEHNIEGWLEEGLVTTEYLADPHNDVWLNICTLPPEQQAAFRIIAQHSPHNFRPRQLSPYEVWTPGSQHFIRLSLAAEADCLYEYARREIAVSTGYFEFKDADLGIGKFRYRAQYQDPHGMRKYLPNDAGYQLVINPFNPERAFIYSQKGQYLGVTPRHHEAMRADVDAIKEQQGKQKQHLADALIGFGVRHGYKNAKAMTHNAAALVDGIRDSLTPETSKPAPTGNAQPDLYADSDLPTLAETLSPTIDYTQLL